MTKPLLPREACNVFKMQKREKRLCQQTLLSASRVLLALLVQLACAASAPPAGIQMVQH
jgi:hypothetical protein